MIGSRMREIRTYGSEEGLVGEIRPFYSPKRLDRFFGEYFDVFFN